MIERKKISVLDHGFVELIDVMGDDARIVEAARLSVSGEGVRKVSEDNALIRYLMRHKHWTPFEMVEFTFNMKMPIFVARQFVRHRTANINEMSARYSELPEEYYTPALMDICFQAKKNKQGRAEALPLELARPVQVAFHHESERAFQLYQRLLGKLTDKSIPGEPFFNETVTALAEGGGVARELARINLPLSTYTQWYWKCDLRNIFNLLSLRLDTHAQTEIRVYAQAMTELIAPFVPVALEAFDDYVLGAVTLSRQDIEALRFMLGRELYFENGISTKQHKTTREGDEFIEKLKQIFNG